MEFAAKATFARRTGVDSFEVKTPAFCAHLLDVAVPVQEGVKYRVHFLDEEPAKLVLAAPAAPSAADLLWPWQGQRAPDLSDWEKLVHESDRPCTDVGLERLGCPASLREEARVRKLLTAVMRRRRRAWLSLDDVAAVHMEGLAPALQRMGARGRVHVRGEAYALHWAAVADAAGPLEDRRGVMPPAAGPAGQACRRAAVDDFFLCRQVPLSAVEGAWTENADKATPVPVADAVLHLGFYPHKRAEQRVAVTRAGRPVAFKVSGPAHVEVGGARLSLARFLAEHRVPREHEDVCLLREPVREIVFHVTRSEDGAKRKRTEAPAVDPALLARAECVAASARVKVAPPGKKKQDE